MTEQSYYQKFWDGYVDTVSTKVDSGKLQYPGAEWGHEDIWINIFNNFFVRTGVKSWSHCLEIGQGAGKYTEKVLSFNLNSKVYAFDVSQKFIDVCSQRLKKFIDEDRLKLFHLKCKDSGEIYKTVEELEIVRKIDSVFSIDSMVHVDMQYLVAYFITSALVLKPNGYLILTLADCTTPQGFQKLLNNVKKHYPLQGNPVGKFEWTDRYMVGFILEKLGFKVCYLDYWSSSIDQVGRDLYVVAKLVDVKEGLKKFIL